MASSTFTVFKGASTTKSIKIDPTEKVAALRGTLEGSGYIGGTDLFLYFNPVTQEKTVLTKAQEQTVPVSACTFPSVPTAGFDNPIIQTVNVAGSDPSFLGTSPEDGWLRHSTVFGVKASLNPQFASQNSGMFKPVMLQNVMSADPNNPVSFTNCIICMKGAILQLEMTCWGALGFGYSITSAMGTDIIPEEGLYRTYTDATDASPGQQGTVAVQRYANGFKPNGDSIQIKSNAALNIASKYNVEYSTLTFSAWNLSQATYNGTTLNNSTPIPTSPSADLDPLGAFFFVEADGPAGGGWNPPPPAGGISVPKGGTQPGSPTAGPPSNQTYGAPMTWPYSPSSKPATRSQGLVGSIEVYMLVFTDETAANNIIRVLNHGTMGIQSN